MTLAVVSISLDLVGNTFSWPNRNCLAWIPVFLSLFEQIFLVESPLILLESPIFWVVLRCFCVGAPFYLLLNAIFDLDPPSFDTSLPRVWHALGGRPGQTRAAAELPCFVNKMAQYWVICGSIWIRWMLLITWVYFCFIVWLICIPIIPSIGLP